MTRLAFTVPGNPIPWKRARTNGKRRFNLPEVEAWKRAVGYAANEALLYEGWPPDAAYRVSVDFYRKNRTGTDIDRLLSAVLDGMEGVLYAADRQVTSIGKVDLFIDKKNPRAEVTVEVVEEAMKVGANRPRKRLGIGEVA